MESIHDKNFYTIGTIEKAEIRGYYFAEVFDFERTFLAITEQILIKGKKEAIKFIKEYHKEYSKQFTKKPCLCIKGLSTTHFIDCDNDLKTCIYKTNTLKQ